MDQPSLANPEQLQQVLPDQFSRWVHRVGLRVGGKALGNVRLALAVIQPLVRAGGVQCGQSMMTVADSAMLPSVVTHPKGFRQMATVWLPTSFVRGVKADAGAVALVARVLSEGRSLVFGEIELRGHASGVADHTTA